MGNWLDKAGLIQLKNILVNKLNTKIDKRPNVPAGKFLQTNGEGYAVWGDAASPDAIVEATKDWLQDNVSGGQTIAVDNSLSVPKAAADAKAAGDLISAVKKALLSTSVYCDFIDGQKFYYPEFGVASVCNDPFTKIPKTDNAMIVAPCQKGDVFYIKAAPTNSQIRPWVVTDANGEAIQVVSPADTSYPTFTRFEITWDNSAYLVINSYYPDVEAALIKVNEDLFNQVIADDEADDNSFVSDCFEFVTGQRYFMPEYRKSSTYTSPLEKNRNDNYTMIIAPCQKGDVFYIKGRGEKTNRLWSVCDSNGQLIQTSAINATYTTFTRLEIEWDNSAYIVINSYFAEIKPGLVKVSEDYLPKQLRDYAIQTRNEISDSVEFITGQTMYYYEPDKASYYTEPLNKYTIAGQAMIVAPCQKGDVFYIKAAPTNSQIRPWSVCRSDGTLIQTVSPAATSYPAWTKLEMTWDESAYLVINSKVATVVPGAVKVNENMLNDNLYTLANNAMNGVVAINEFVNNSIVTQIKPEDFIGDTMAEKVKNAVAFLNSCAGSCELYFGNSDTYIITEAIVLPSNTKVVVNNCTIKLADGIHDNVFRTSNLIPDPTDRNDFCTCNGGLNNITITGIGTAIIAGPDVRYVGPTAESETPVEWVGDAFGWRGHTTLFVGVNNFEISGLLYQNCICWETVLIGCAFGKVHDISSNSGNKNNDMVDVLTGCKFIDVFNLSGFSADDAVAVCAVDNARASSGVTPPIYPIMPLEYENYMFGADTHDIRVNNVCTSGTGGSTAHQLVMLTGKNKVYNVFASNISDTGNKRAGLIKVYGSYLRTYTDGNIYNVFVNNIECNKATKCLILGGMPHNSKINKLVINNGATPIDKGSPTPSYEEANTIITNIIIDNT